MRARAMDQLKIIYQLTKPLVPAIQHRSLYKHSAEDEVRHAGKSSTHTDPSEHEQDHCRAEYNERSRKHNVCDRGMRTLNNLFVQQFEMSIVKDAA